MNWYVAIDKMNGRNDYFSLAKMLLEHGYTDVEYSRGGWDDKEIGSVLPHLKFTRKDDAIAFALTFGGTASTRVPVRESV